MNKKDNKNNIYKIIIIILMVIIIGLIGLLISGKVEINKKTKETVISSKTVEEQSDIKTAISKVYDAVVVVEAYKQDSLYSTGTGFVYKKEGNSSAKKSEVTKLLKNF